MGLNAEVEGKLQEETEERKDKQGEEKRGSRERERKIRKKEEGLREKKISKMSWKMKVHETEIC